MTERNVLMEKLEQAYQKSEKSPIMKAAADKFEAMHGSLMPRTYVGENYLAETYAGVKKPRILIFSINQSRQGQDLSDDDVRKSMRTILQDSDGKYLPDGFGPRALAANLARWILMQLGVPAADLDDPKTVHSMIAYDNFVKWPFNTANSEPDKNIWQTFYPINKAVVEVLQPDIILCLGKPVYNAIWNSVKDNGIFNYDWKSCRTGWVYDLKTPWGKTGVGCVYHYSNPQWPNRAWKEMTAAIGKIPTSLMELLDDEQKSNIDLLIKQMRGIDSDQQKYPWWGEEIYAGKSFTQYNPYSKYVAWIVCRQLACNSVCK